MLPLHKDVNEHLENVTGHLANVTGHLANVNGHLANIQAKQQENYRLFWIIIVELAVIVGIMCVILYRIWPKRQNANQGKS